MTDSRTKAGNTQDKPGASHSTKTQGKKTTTQEIKQWWVGGSVKKNTSANWHTPNGQTGKNLSIKINIGL